MKCLFATSYLFMTPHQNQQAQAMNTHEDLWSAETIAVLSPKLLSYKINVKLSLFLQK